MEITQTRGTPSGLLYPMMVIAAIAVIAFSIVGIATMTGLMPHAMVGKSTAIAAQTIDSPVVAAQATQDTSRTFECAECGLIQSVREIEQRGSLWATPVAAIIDEPVQVTTTGL